jgi:hypothetical protein
MHLYLFDKKSFLFFSQTLSCQLDHQFDIKDHHLAQQEVEIVLIHGAQAEAHLAATLPEVHFLPNHEIQEDIEVDHILAVHHQLQIDCESEVVHRLYQSVCLATPRLKNRW